jgi:hypothetical protein
MKDRIGGFVVNDILGTVQGQIEAGIQLLIMNVRLALIFL